jgi:hypothetical protein
MANPHVNRIAEILVKDQNVDKKTLVIAGTDIGGAMLMAVSGKVDLLAEMRRSLTELRFSQETIDAAVNAARPFAELTKQLGTMLGEGSRRY